VQKVFRAKCNQCHGSHLAKPKGKFGYILDLGRVAGNPKIVVPSKPDESRLWELVSGDEMPPEDAQAGPLTAEEKNLIHDWIAAGAPAMPGSSATSSESADEPEPSEMARLPFYKRALFLLGRFHVIVVHFPIALIMAAAAGELWFWWLGYKGLHPAVRFCVLLAVPAAIAAAVLGWLLAWSGAGLSAPQVLLFHRWLGTVGAVWLVAVAASSEADARHSTRSALSRVLLFAGAILIGVTGHLGGTLVYGEDYFRL
jgi:uncharacterized membrane protein